MVFYFTSLIYSSRLTIWFTFAQNFKLQIFNIKFSSVSTDTCSATTLLQTPNRMANTTDKVLVVMMNFIFYLYFLSIKMNKFFPTHSRHFDLKGAQRTIHAQRIALFMQPTTNCREDFQANNIACRSAARIYIGIFSQSICYFMKWYTFTIIMS